MSRRQHPLDALLPHGIHRQSDALSAAPQGFNCSITLSNEHGDTNTLNLHLNRIPDDPHEWPDFWANIRQQLSWNINLLLAAPIANSITSTDLLEYTCAVPLSDRFKVYFGEYPDLYRTMQNVDRDTFAAVQHLCKIQYRRMQLGR